MPQGGQGMQGMQGGQGMQGMQVLTRGRPMFNMPALMFLYELTC